MMVLDPSSDFFRYLKNQGGAGREGVEVVLPPSRATRGTAVPDSLWTAFALVLVVEGLLPLRRAAGLARELRASS